MEFVKTLIAAALSPITISLTMQCVGWLWWIRSDSGRRGKSLIATGTLVLLIGSLPSITFEARRRSEFQHDALVPAELPNEPVRLVELGTGFNPDNTLPANSRVGGAFLSRLLEAVRILRDRPDAELIVSIAGPAPAADKQRFWREMSGILQLENVKAELITDAESTLDEARLVRRLIKDEAIVLATSAGHMPRAMQIFTDEGMQVIPAPTDYTFVRAGSPRDNVWDRWIPSAGGINSNHAWLYEAAAGLWQRVRPR